MSIETNAHISLYLFCDFQDLFVLLDLLGTANPRFYSYFENTDKIYEKLSGIEKRLSKTGVLEKYSYSSADNVDQNQLYFQPYSFRAGIDDDHVPFMQRNVLNPPTNTHHSNNLFRLIMMEFIFCRFPYCI